MGAHPSSHCSSTEGLLSLHPSWLTPRRAILSLCLSGLRKRIPLSHWISIIPMTQPPFFISISRMFRFLNETWQVGVFCFFFLFFKLLKNKMNHPMHVLEVQIRLTLSFPEQQWAVGLLRGGEVGRGKWLIPHLGSGQVLCQDPPSSQVTILSGCAGWSPDVSGGLEAELMKASQLWDLIQTPYHPCTSVFSSQ